jgi:stage V sporulation protein B
MDQADAERARTSRPAFGRDVALLTIVRLASVGAGFLTSVLAARILGASAVGAAGVAMTIATVSALVCNGGLNIAAIYFLGRRPHERREIVRHTFTLGLVAGALAILLVAASAPIIAGLIPALPAELFVAAAVLAASIIGFELGGSLVLGLDLRGMYLRVQSVEGIGSLVTTAVILLAVSPTSTGFVAAAAMAYLAAALYATLTVRRSVGTGLLGFDARFSREAIGLGLRGQVGNVLQFLNLRLDLLLIPLFVDLGAAGVYLVAVRMSEVVSQVASASAAFLFPAVARDDPSATELTERTIRLTLAVVILIGLVIAAAADILLSVFFGSVFQAGSSALRITMLAMIPLALTRLLASDVKGRGRPGLVSIAAAISLVATIGCNLLLIPVMGIEGAAVASLLAYSLGAAVLMVAFARLTGTPSRRLFPGPRDFAAIASVAARLLAGARQRSGSADS